MPDRPTPARSWQRSGKARSCADLTAYLGSLVLQKLADLLGELPESTRMALLYGCHRQGRVECCPVSPDSARQHVADLRRTRSAETASSYPPIEPGP
jgi:hypothetical protein